MAGNITIDIRGGAELVAAMRKMDRKFVRDINRGALGEAANAIRDRARQNARSVGLGRSGPAVTPGGYAIVRHGKIPNAINAAGVGRGGVKARAKVYVAPMGLRFGGREVDRTGGTMHWRWIEFGSIHNTPQPFFARAGTEAAEEAVERAAAVYRKWVDLFNRSQA